MKYSQENNPRHSCLMKDHSMVISYIDNFGGLVIEFIEPELFVVLEITLVAKLRVTMIYQYSFREMELALPRNRLPMMVRLV